MSQEYYQEQWREAQKALKKSLEVEVKIKKKGPYEDVGRAKWLIGHLFMSYVGIANKLNDCYDQMIHPQKREAISRLLDLSLGRLLEIKSEIVRIELDDYCFFDNVLIELKLTHQDLEIHVPKYFWTSKEKTLQHRKSLIRQVFEEAEREIFKSELLKHVPDEEKAQVWEKYLLKEETLRIEKEKYEEQQRKLLSSSQERPVDSVELIKREYDEALADENTVFEAIALIQRHERARQGRTRATFAKRNKQLKASASTHVLSEDLAEASAKVIQQHWRRYKKRKERAKTSRELELVLDMRRPNHVDPKKKKKLEMVTKIRRKLQERNKEEYEEAFERVKEKVRVAYSIRMEEDTTDELMAWFKWHFEQSGYLPDFPPPKPVVPTGTVMGIPKKLGPDFENKLFPPKKGKAAEKSSKLSSLAMALAGILEIGGSALVVAGHWLGPKEFLICQKELEKRKKAGKGGGGEKQKMTKEEKLALKKKEKEQEKRRLLAEEAAGFQLRNSNFLTPLNKADRDYRITWMDRDESKNPEQKYIYDFVKEEKCLELSMSIRAVVDEIMELELEILKDALERDKNPKKRGKKKKGKKNKKEKKKKGKKDPTGERSTDELFIELFRNGIIRDYEQDRLDKYLGERSLGAFDMRQRHVDWAPSSGDVRDLVLQLCILPLGSPVIHRLGPLIKSVCLLGTENSGKEFLARIICTETASVVFDLTPENVAGKYPGKDGLKMLQHLVEKMSRVLQPSVIFVNGAEKTYYKKVPKEERHLEPKRLAKMIGKIAKGIKAEDQVLVLGASSQPWMAQKNKMLKTYQKTIQVPQMDYGSYVRLWQALLESYASFPKNFDVSCLARVSDGYSVKTLMDAIQKVLTIERIGSSSFRPFSQVEFLDELLKSKATDPKFKEKSLKFYSSLELPKKKAKKLEELQQEAEKAKKTK